MSSLTDIRRALSASLEDLDADVIVAPAGGKYEEQSEKFTVRILVGESTPGAEERLDDLLGCEPGSVRAVLKADPELGGCVSASQVVSHSGWRLFNRADAPPLLGSELLVQTFA
jgi:hypothetical protein